MEYLHYILNIVKCKEEKYAYVMKYYMVQNPGHKPHAY